MMLNKFYAFSLIEVLIVIALIATVFLIGIPIGQSALNSGELDTAYEVSINSLRNAQALSVNGFEDSIWGVRFNNNSITLFKGNDYSTRDVSYDVNTQLSTIVSINGMSEVFFSKYEGIPNNTANITISVYDKNKTINILDNGLIN